MLGDEHPRHCWGNFLSGDEAVGLDLRYVENWSLALDALIIGEDAVVIVKRSGAY